MKTSVFLIACIIALGPLRASAHYVQELQKVLKAEEEVRPKLNAKLAQAIKEASQQVASTKNKSFDEDVSNKISTIVDIRNDIRENHLRIEFLNTFINKLDSIAAQSDIRKTAESILLDLSQKQLISGAENDSENDLWLFQIYLAIAIRDIMEPNENFAQFVKKFVVFSSLREPRSPSEFLKERSYIEP